MDICTSGTQWRGDRAIGPYDISCRVISEKVGRSIRLRAAFDKRGHGEVWGAPKAEWVGTRSVFLWGPGFSALNRRIVRWVSSVIWIVLGENLAVVGKNYLQEGKGS